MSFSLADEYAKQFAWRDWETALNTCPIRPGQKVLDLGCGRGDLSFELSKRGAVVVGIDTQKELTNIADKRNLQNCTFINQDLNSLNLELNAFDGIWGSFTAAYFTDLEGALRKWMPYLKQNAWICLTEMDDLFGHEPMTDHFRILLNEFYNDSFTQSKYDFRSGHKLATNLQKLDFTVQEKLLADQELVFNGPADPAILQAWTNRFDRMNRLKNFFGAEFEEFKSIFFASLESEDHISKCRVFCVVGSRA